MRCSKWKKHKNTCEKNRTARERLALSEPIASCKKEEVFASLAWLCMSLRPAASSGFLSYEKFAFPSKCGLGWEGCSNFNPHNFKPPIQGSIRDGAGRKQGQKAWAGKSAPISR